MRRPTQLSLPTENVSNFILLELNFMRKNSLYQLFDMYTIKVLTTLRVRCVDCIEDIPFRVKSQTQPITAIATTQANIQTTECATLPALP